MILVALYILFLGICAGSFVNALVWRLHEQNKKKNFKPSIINGRSMCTQCKHELAWYDLVPIFSWLILRGKCRYCKKPISLQYPIVELVAGFVFVGSYLFWPVTVHTGGQWLLLATWLTCSVGLLALAVYDLHWMLLPNKIIYPTFLVAFVGRLVFIIVFGTRPWHLLLLWIFSVAISSGIFFLLFTVSKGKWIGFGDVRLGLITGTLLADPAKSMAMLFLASLIGTAVIVPALTRGDKKMTSKLPYGPFLIIATGVLVVFGDSLLNWYKNLIT